MNVLRPDYTTDELRSLCVSDATNKEESPNPNAIESGKKTKPDDTGMMVFTLTWKTSAAAPRVAMALVVPVATTETGPAELLVTLGDAKVHVASMVNTALESSEQAEVAVGWQLSAAPMLGSGYPQELGPTIVNTGERPAKRRGLPTAFPTIKTTGGVHRRQLPLRTPAHRPRTLRLPHHRPSDS